MVLASSSERNRVTTSTNLYYWVGSIRVGFRTKYSNYFIQPTTPNSMNGSDQSFELQISRNRRKVRDDPCFAKHHGPTLYIYRERVRLKRVMTHQISMSHAPNLDFENSNDWSESFNLFFILKSHYNQILHFLNFFYILSDR